MYTSYRALAANMGTETPASDERTPMQLTPHEQERLLLSYAADLAERRRQRGLKLNHPEAVAILSSFLLEGARDGRRVADLMQAGREVLTRFELPIQGQSTRMLKAGDGFQIPPDTPHAGGKAGDAKTRVLITYVVEKGKPVASPA